MKLLFNISIFLICTCLIYAQNEDLALKYERATKLVDAKEALIIYQQIIDSNKQSDYVWLSKLKKAEMLYAQGAYITSSKILKEFNLNGPDHLQTASSKDLFLRSLNAAGQNDSLKVYQGILSSKKSSTKKNHKKFLSKTPFFLSNLCRVSRYTCETERPKKTPKPRDRARKEATTSGDIFVVEEERREKRVLRCFST